MSDDGVGSCPRTTPCPRRRRTGAPRLPRVPRQSGRLRRQPRQSAENKNGTLLRPSRFLVPRGRSAQRIAARIGTGRRGWQPDRPTPPGGPISPGHLAKASRPSNPSAGRSTWRTSLGPSPLFTETTPTPSGRRGSRPSANPYGPALSPSLQPGAYKTSQAALPLVGDASHPLTRRPRAIPPSGQTPPPRRQTG